MVKETRATASLFLSEPLIKLICRISLMKVI